MTDRRNIRGVPHNAIKAYVETAGRPVAMSTLCKLPAFRHYKRPEASVRRVVKALEAEGFLTHDTEASTVERRS